MIPNGFATARLRIVRWKDPAQDAVLRAALPALLTAHVTAQLPPALQIDPGDPSAIDRWIAARDAESDVFAITRKADGQTIGLLIVAPATDTSPPDCHIGYLFSQAAWGQGYGTELLQGLVTACRSYAPLRLLGGVERSNVASARVLQKAGFVADPETEDAETVLYLRDIAPVAG